MEEVFIPVFVKSFRWLSLCIIGGLGGVLLAYLSFKRKNFPSRPAAQLTGMFLGLVGIGGAAFILTDILRSPTIVVAKDHMIVGNTKHDQSAINKAYIKAVSRTNRVNQSESRDVGIVTFKDSTNLLLSQDRYDVKAVIAAIRKMKEK